MTAIPARARILRAIVPTVLATFALVALVAAPAQATKTKRVKITGESTTLTLSKAAGDALAANGITVAPVDPATANPDGSLSFPITGGRVNPENLHGFITHKGAIKLTKGDKTAVLRRFVIVNGRRGAYLDGLALVRKRVRGHGFRGVHHGAAKVRYVQVYRAIRILKLGNVVRADAGGKVVVTADGSVTRAAAGYLNRKLDTTLFAEGLAIGSAKVTATVAS
jgi:hypothetical protein